MIVSKRKGQTVMEYVVLIVVIIAALITMQVYVKRGFQGRWKAAVDDLGDQYDSNSTNIELNYVYASNSETSTRTDPLANGDLQTMRYDRTTATESKTGVWKTKN